MLEIRGGIIIPVNPSGKVIRDGVIRIEDGKIVTVGPAENPPSQGVEVIDAKDSLILPGLVNTHTHAAMTLLRSYADDLPLMEWLQQKIWPAEERLTGEDIYWGTRLAIQEMALGGITTFVDMYDFMEDVARAVEETGVRSILSRGLIGVTPHPELKLEAGVDLCKHWEGKANGRIRTMLAPHAPYTCPPEFLKEIMAAARELKTGFNIHLAETEAGNQPMLVQYGQRPFE
jgi:5-methylthioadenosine/S-adenosylhomocysteine deaminase